MLHRPDKSKYIVRVCCKHLAEEPPLAGDSHSSASLVRSVVMVELWIQEAPLFIGGFTFQPATYSHELWLMPNMTLQIQAAKMIFLLKVPGLSLRVKSSVSS